MGEGMRERVRPIRGTIYGHTFAKSPLSSNGILRN